MLIVVTLPFLRIKKSILLCHVDISCITYVICFRPQLDCCYLYTHVEIARPCIQRCCYYLVLYWHDWICCIMDSDWVGGGDRVWVEMMTSWNVLPLSIISWCHSPKLPVPTPPLINCGLKTRDMWCKKPQEVGNYRCKHHFVWMSKLHWSIFDKKNGNGGNGYSSFLIRAAQMTWTPQLDLCSV